MARPSTRSRKRKRISYREDSSDSDDLLDLPSPSNVAIRSKTKASRLGGLWPRSSVEKAKSGHEALNEKEQGDTAIQFTGKLMPWQTLPYQILVSIFDYASYPLIGSTFAPLPSVAWLLRTALCCKAFAEPALSVLYHSPPLYPPTRARALIDHLATQDRQTFFNYRAKVKYIEVEAYSTLLHKYAGQDPIDLGTLVTFTPQLRGIGIDLISDNLHLRKAAPSRSVAGRSVYQQSLFTALQEGKAMLREWTWNQSLAKQSHPLTNLRDVHLMTPFQTLRNVTLVSYEGGPLEKGRCREDILMEALNILPNLRYLSFRMSSIVNARLMAMLPDNLQALEIIKCVSLESRALNNFLVGKGINLRQLVLDHNHSLNLSFLVELSNSCPKLEILKMDLRYFNTFFTVRDSDPKYERLFQDGEIPSWPESLQSLELFHLRKWSLATAELFFSSLTDAAGSLPHLRQLKIKASLDESGWRDRIAFRDKWTQRLEHVFLRISTPPSNDLKSFATFKALKKQQQKKKKALNTKLGSDGSPDLKAKGAANLSMVRHKRSANLTQIEISRIPAKVDESDSDAPLIKARRGLREGTDSDAPLSNVRRSTRAKPRKDDFTLSESSPIVAKAPRRRRRRRGSNESSSEDSAIDDDGIDRTMQQSPEDTELPSHIQGLCDIVDVLIDNLRPTEEQLNENDFLDDEVSGDEDWNGDDDLPGDGGYAW